LIIVDFMPDRVAMQDATHKNGTIAVYDGKEKKGDYWPCSDICSL